MLELSLAGISGRYDGASHVGNASCSWGILKARWRSVNSRLMSVLMQLCPTECDHYSLTSTRTVGVTGEEASQSWSYDLSEIIRRQ